MQCLEKRGGLRFRQGCGSQCCQEARPRRIVFQGQVMIIQRQRQKRLRAAAEQRVPLMRQIRIPQPAVLGDPVILCRKQRNP